MKKATRLLILTAFVFPLLIASRAYAGGPRPGQPIFVHHSSPLANGFHATEPDNDPLRLQDPIGDPAPDMYRNDLFNRVHDHDPYAGAGQPAVDPSGNGGGNAPIDGGISLLLAAGIGLGIKRARARKQTV
jgi:hypothetical protein